METVKYQWLPGVKREGGMNRQDTEDLYSSEAILYYTVMVDTCRYIICLN